MEGSEGNHDLSKQSVLRGREESRTWCRVLQEQIAGLSMFQDSLILSLKSVLGFEWEGA